MPTNAQLIKSDMDLTVADLGSTGKLNDEQAESFIRLVEAESVILQAARKVVMSKPTMTIPTIGFTGRVMRPATSGVALTHDLRVKPTIEGITLTTKEGIATVYLPYDTIEDNIERGNLNIGGAGAIPRPASGGLVDTVMAQLAVKVAVDLEDLAVNGDTTSGDVWLAQQDGWLKLMTSNVVNFQGQPISKTLFKNGIQTLPDQYKNRRASLRNYLSMDQEIEYIDQVASRETTKGDNVLNAVSVETPFGSQLVGSARIPTTQGFLSDPLNLIWGVQRDISIETTKNIEERVHIIVLTIRSAIEIEIEDACVRFSNIGAPI